MATQVTCDTCGAKVGAAGFKVVSVADAPREVDDPRGDYCSASCVARAVAKAGAGRPDFKAARVALDRAASLHDLDERFLRGEYGNPGASLLPFSPPARLAS
jgi:hypothetical protein